MKYLHIFWCSFLLIIGSTKLCAQMQKNFSHTKSPWFVGVGINAIEDDGKLWPPIVKNTWNFVPFVSRISISKNLKKNFSMEGVVSYNQYQAEKKINGTINHITKNYFTLDVLIKYGLSRPEWGMKRVDPFIMLGPGFVLLSPIKNETNAGTKSRGAVSGDVGGGMNFWISNKFGFTVQAVAKLISSKAVSSHFQYSFGCFYKLSANTNIKLKKAPSKIYGQRKQRMIRGTRNGL